MNLATSANTFGLSELDRTIIIDAVENSTIAGLSIIQIQKRIKDINVNHYIFLGYVMGYCSGAQQIRDEIFNNFQPCQRQN